MVQITGKKSYARVREELKVIALDFAIVNVACQYPSLILIFLLFIQASLGKDPSRMDMFDECFCKDGNTKTVEAEKAIVSNLLIYLLYIK